MGAVFIFILLALLWVVLIVPRQREVRRHNALVASLEVGDEVMTGAGIYGAITEISDDDVWIEIAPDVTVKMAKRAVGSKIVPDPDATPIADEPADHDAGLDRSPTERTED
jgi:preprotein translocase subunit YajC